MVASQKRKKAKKSMSGMAIRTSHFNHGWHGQRYSDARAIWAAQEARACEYACPCHPAYAPRVISAQSPRLFGRFAAKPGVQVDPILRLFMIRAGAAKKQGADAHHRRP